LRAQKIVRVKHFLAKNAQFFKKIAQKVCTHFLCTPLLKSGVAPWRATTYFLAHAKTDCRGTKGAARCRESGDDRNLKLL